MTEDNVKLSAGQMIFSVIYPFVYSLILLGLAGDWRWIEGWIFIGFFMLMYFWIMIYLVCKDPALLMERFKRPGTSGQKQWDRWFLNALLVLFLLWYAVMPLDARRYHWTNHFPLVLEGLGVLFLIISLFFLIRVFIDNTYLSPLVRIQSERGQHVVSTGVYGFVRHPMYLGAALMFIGTPLLLGSVYGVWMGLILALTLPIRIIGEEQMLVNELDGYAEYRKKVRYRLIPYVW